MAKMGLRMRRSSLVSLLLLCPFALHAIAGDRPQLMILGTTHFNNPNHDMANMVVDDVLTPVRQGQIQVLVNSIARFRPTRIAIEMPPTDQASLDRRYAEYRAGHYQLTSNERDPLGLRLASMLNLPALDAVDYKSGPPGPDEAYDFAGYAAAHGQQDQLDDWLAAGKQYATSESQYLHTHTMIEWFRRANTPAYRQSNDRFYFGMLRFGDDKSNPGANWVGGWHARNMIILENIGRRARPDDRVLVIFGAGRAFLRDRFARESGLFHVVDTEKFLTSASAVD